jgi:uncharacterized membrane protein
MNRLKEIFRRIVPPPRRQVTWQSLTPFVIFLVVFAGICTSVIPTVTIRAASPQAWSRVQWIDLSFLTQWGIAKPEFEVFRALEFARPWWFLLLLVTPWIWWLYAAGHSGLPKVRGQFAVFVRLMICGFLVLVLAEARAVRTSDVVSVVYNVDVSDSVNEARNVALSMVADTAAQKPATDQAGLVVFGRTAAVEYPPRETFPFEKFINSRVSQDATNLEQSLALSAAMLPEENLGKIVLISDGTETVGQLKDVVDDLQSRGIEVDVVPVDYDYKDEVLLERMDLPRFVRLGETYDASVVLTSLAPGEGTLVLSQGGTELERLSVKFEAGKNRFSIPIQVGQPGYYEYSARIEVAADADNRPENNEVRNYLFIDGPGRILVITDPDGDANEWSYFVQALQQGERQVEVRNALEFPIDPLSLMPYDAVIFADVAADAFTGIQMQAMHDAVRNLGIGFLMVGGPNSFGPGGYSGSVIEDALPISMEISNKKILPKGALAIILHTCEFPQGNSWAKRITKKAIQVLSSEDLVGALGYGMNGEEWIFELTEAGNYGSLVPKINAAQIGDMPDFASTMRMGLKGLVESDAASRHMIIISDGDAGPPSDALLAEFLDPENKVTVSTVAVFPHDGNTQVLEMIAGVTGGRFYFPSDPNQLPSIFIKEAKTLRRSQLQERTFVPELRSVDPVIRDIGVPPELHGYVLTSPKEDPRASVVLAAPPNENEIAAGDADVDPVLAVWRYGLGVTAAFTSDMTSRWGTEWLGWDQYQQFVNQLITRVGRVRREQFLRVYTYTNGNEGVVVVEDFHPEESMLDVNVTVSGPNNFQTSQPVRQIAPRRYQTSMPLRGEGRYQVQINALGSDRKETSYAGFIVSYSPEYLRFRANPIILKEIAEKTGGRELEVADDPEAVASQIFGERVPKRSSRPVFDWFLMMLACLIPLDVALRRVQISFTWLKDAFNRDHKESTATMGALLQRAGEVRSSLDSRSERKPGGFPAAAASKRTDQKKMSLPPKPLQRPESAPKPATSTSADSDTPADDGGTTSRLLALKRKREEEQNK